ncbi:uroplakin-1b [Latimeria chalumnae]|uniref:Tetraspanin n=1 Tax=Latimeria chalumnae TaxID=7897 RepID=H3B427_LATCH|nr:PREDICTED: uroplakin-1b [Latimeria chalumnae]XP_014344896.1 PREDICTED: uroplakin-1b [Latimeria chalumnae]|eukprot:XP_005997673.1 PREDICTED: uroplakin-1b [Latimeria chalumnae]
MALKGSSPVRCFQGLLIFGNVVIALTGLTLFAACIFFLSDDNRYYRLLDASENDDIFAAAWISLFVGFSFFLLSILGIIGVMKSNRTMLLVYIILMLVVYCFEVASCITAITHRDFFIPNMFLKTLLEKYQKPKARDLDEQGKIDGVTTIWNRIMPQHKCCGVNGPMDWQEYNSSFRMQNSDADFPWPRQCCVRAINGEPQNLDACKLGIVGSYYAQGCFEFIAGPLNRHAWGVAWYGFAILCWVFWVLAVTMFYFSRIDSTE